MLDATAALARANELVDLGFRVRYAVKAAPVADLVLPLTAAGHGVDVASAAEVELAHELGVDSTRVIASHPTLPEPDVYWALARNVRLFVVDSLAQLERLGASSDRLGVDRREVRVLVRVGFADPEARYQLSEKFGVDVETATDLILAASRLSLQARGVAFHLGSQAASPASATDAATRALDLVRRAGLDDPIVDVGGGFPGTYPGAADWHPFAEALATPLVGRVETLAEPGRLLASADSVVVTTVTQLVERGGVRVAHLDAGAYHGLMEFSPLVGRPLEAYLSVPAHPEPGPLAPTQLVGPTCDSLDRLFDGPVNLPAALAVGDRILVESAGAYSVGVAAPFNGFAVPRVYVRALDHASTRTTAAS